jgi:predicted MFS family arabinose efflux permease
VDRRGYALSLGLLLVPSGRFGDAHGRRPVFMLGVALFVVASAASALAPTAFALVLMRLVQGFAGGLISPQISGLIQSLFRGEERGRAFGLFGATIGVSTAVGPLTGGALIALFGVHDGWRAVFFVNLPIGAAILLLARRYLPAPTAAERRPQALDPLGVVLLGAAVVCILVPFIEQRTWHSPLRLALFPLAAVLLVVWVLHERRYSRTREPLVSLDLFRNRSYVLGAPVGLMYFAGFVAMFFILTQYLQLGLNYPAWKSGLAATPFAIGGALVASAGSRQALRRGPKLVAFGLATVLVGMAGVWLAVGAHPGQDVALWTALPLLIAGLGGGLVISPNLTLTLSQVPVERAGSAGGVLQTGQRIVGRPRRRPDRLTADRGYDHDTYLRELRRAASPRRSRAARPNTAPGSVACAGSSNAPSPGYTTSRGCVSATTAATRFTTPSSRSAAASSVSGDSAAHWIRAPRERVGVHRRARVRRRAQASAGARRRRCARLRR